MNTTRRSFLSATLGAVMAPAIVKSENLMKIFVPPEKKIIQQFGVTLSLNLYGDDDNYKIYPHIGDIFFPTNVLDPELIGLHPSHSYELNRAGILMRRPLVRNLL